MAGPDLSERLRGGLVGVALGEALGLPWVGRGPREIKRDRLLAEVGPTREVTAAVLAAAATPPGAPPKPSRDDSTSPTEVESSLDAGGGAEGGAGGGAEGGARGGAEGDGTGDALARALVLGWREPAWTERRAHALGHGFAAVLVADLAAWALARRPLYHLVADHAKDWAPPFRGVALDDRAVVDALMAILHRHDDPADGMRAAVRLGGGATATLGALVGGMLGCRYPSAIETSVAWRERVALPDAAALDAAVDALRSQHS